MAYGAAGTVITGSPPACRVTNSTTQSLTSNVEVAITFDTESYDTDTMHSTVSNTSRITFNTPGVYVVTASGTVQANVDNLDAYLDVRLNGVTRIGYGVTSGTYTSGGFTRVAVSTQYKFAAADYIEVIAFQKNGAAGARTLASHMFAATWLGLGT